ncbi:MAG: UbiA family prenyltransferase [Candidatus Bathyarchaeota archaeon]
MLTRITSPYYWLLRSELRVGFYSWFMFVGMIAGLKTLPALVLILKSLLAMFSMALSVYVYNDVSDIEADKISAEVGEIHYIHRPLVTGKATVLNAKIFILVLACIGLGIALSINLQFFALLSLYGVLGISYSTPPFNLKNRFLLKQLVIASGQAVSCLAGGAAVGIISAPVVYTTALFFTLTFCATPLLDIRDIYADKKVGRRTFPIVIGPKSTIKFTTITTLAIILISLVSYSWSGFNSAFAILFSASFFLYFYSVFYIYKNLNNPNLIEKAVRQMIRPFAIIIQISVIIGVIQL